MSFRALKRKIEEKGKSNGEKRAHFSSGELPTRKGFADIPLGFLEGPIKCRVTHKVTFLTHSNTCLIINLIDGNGDEIRLNVWGPEKTAKYVDKFEGSSTKKKKKVIPLQSYTKEEHSIKILDDKGKKMEVGCSTIEQFLQKMKIEELKTIIGLKGVRLIDPASKHTEELKNWMAAESSEGETAEATK
ncbi:hypothetical protein OUZ56_026245 [Daphnia magna]|uniref:Uncharacterized protein n=1 Tax=Daphnia magna TaxID=35525 RepID=A0ABQ9ZL81_9CRUS|nr:hypothetical protein OUZ56_026245 [Daphnia magna]